MEVPGASTASETLRPATSPEASGGKGTVLEHRFGGRLLAALLLRAPIEGLGGSFVPVRVKFQGGEAVDDLVVDAEGAGEAVAWYVASRMRPTLTVGTPKTVALAADFLAVLRDRSADVEGGRVLFGLVTLGTFGPAARLRLLSEAAVGDSATFRSAVGRRNKDLRDLLGRLDTIVSAAATKLDWRADVLAERDWTYTLLRALRVVLRSFEPTGPDAVATTTALLALVDGDAERAEALRQHLDALAADLAASGATVTEVDVRLALRGSVRVGAAAALGGALAALDEADASLRRRTGRSLRAGGVDYRIDRSREQNALRNVMREAGERASALVVRGEPSVGKSVLVLDAVDALRAEGAAVATFSLRAPLDLGMPLATVFGGFPVATARLLVLDGAEAVQEGGRDRLADLAAAAHNAGLGVVAVTRDDAAGLVRELLVSTCGGAAGEHVVEPLPDEAVAPLTERFPALARLTDRRSRWLLRRVGLVDLLLRAGPSPSLRDGALSEADVFVACWRGWVRRREEHAPGSPTPDAREATMLDIARAVLHGEPARPAAPDALPSLRSDGLLLPYDALRDGEAFPGDVVRDLATAKHLLADGGSDLTECGAPRWAVRAARVACQGRLLSGGFTELRRQLDVFGDLARSHGARWGDVPWEALLRCGVARELLDEATDFLLKDQGDRLDALLRAVEQHFESGTAVDPVLCEPVVAWLTVTERELPPALQERADRLIVAWLRGVRRDPTADSDATTRQVRQEVRAATLARDPEERDEELLRALAILGNDLSDEVRDLLRRLAADRPAFLEPVVEDVDATAALAETDPELLAALAEAYYIERPHEDWPFGGYSPLDHGIRDHRGVGPPWSHWAYGPFWPLMARSPKLARDLTVAVVGHAARTRVADGTPGGGPSSVTADVLGLGIRTYDGDDHVYAWYRGCTVGPSVCTSALLACERAMDQLVQQGIPVRDVARFFLEPAHDLAMLGLVVGLLVRHLDAVTDELDDFLAVPELWELEVSRVGHQQVLMRIRDEEVHGKALRVLTFQDVAVLLVARAWGDETRTERLRNVGDRLRAATTPTGHDNAPLVVRAWASSLDAANYERVPGGLTYVEPAVLADEHAEIREELRHTATATRLHNTYALGMVPPYFCTPPDVDPTAIIADVEAARSLAGTPSGQERVIAVPAITATAAGAVRAAAAGVTLDPDLLTWACTEVLRGALYPDHSPYEYQATLHSSGVDRSAASALPTMLSLVYDHPDADDEDVDAVIEGLTATTTGLSDEVRRTAALALRDLWSSPCNTGRVCRHRRAWTAVDAGARDVAFTPWDQHGQRGFAALQGDLAAALRTQPDNELMQQRVGIALANVCFALAGRVCVADEAATLLDALLDAYGRASLAYATAGYEVREWEHATVGAALLAATTVQPDVLERAVAHTGGRSLPTAELLEGVMAAATYEAPLRSRLRAVWPSLLAHLLEAPHTATRYSSEGRVDASLIAAPSPSMHDRDIDATSREACHDWPTAGDLAPLIEKWVPLAAGHREALDQLVKLLRASPRDDQVRLGLPWVRRLVEPGGPGGILSRWTVVWLDELRAGGDLSHEARRDYDIVIDALAARGIDIAQELQQKDAGAL